MAAAFVVPMITANVRCHEPLHPATDSLIDAELLLKKRGLLKAYTDVGMYDEIALFILRYSTLQGSEAFREASKYFQDRHNANGLNRRFNSFWDWWDGDRDEKKKRF